MKRPASKGARKGAETAVERAKDWKAVANGKISIMGDALKRPPSGYDAEHPFVEDLKRKGFYTMSKFSDREVCSPDFPERYLGACRNAAPLVHFLTRALRLAW